MIGEYCIDFPYYGLSIHYYPDIGDWNSVPLHESTTRSLYINTLLPRHRGLKLVVSPNTGVLISTSIHYYPDIGDWNSVYDGTLPRLFLSIHYYPDIGDWNLEHDCTDPNIWIINTLLPRHRGLKRSLTEHSSSDLNINTLLPRHRGLKRLWRQDSLYLVKIINTLLPRHRGLKHLGFNLKLNPSKSIHYYPDIGDWNLSLRTEVGLCALRINTLLPRHRGLKHSVEFGLYFSNSINTLLPRHRGLKLSIDIAVVTFSIVVSIHYYPDIGDWNIQRIQTRTRFYKSIHYYPDIGDWNYYYILNRIVFFTINTLLPRHRGLKRILFHKSHLILLHQYTTTPT